MWPRVVIVLGIAVMPAWVGEVRSAFSVTTNAAASFEAAPLFPPRLVSPPSISGVARQGQVLTAVQPTWARRVDTTTTTWLRCDTTCVEAGSNTTLQLAASDVGKRFELRVTATNPAGTTTATSARTNPVLPPLPINTVRPVISGTPKVGETLRISDGTWTGSPRLTYRWLRCQGTDCSFIDGATRPEYLVTGEDVSRTIDGQVVGTNDGGTAFGNALETTTVVRAAFTQILCRNPDTGTYVGQDGQLPDGMSFARTHTSFPIVTTAARCATGPVGIPLATGTGWSTPNAGIGGHLMYRDTSQIGFQGATLYRQGQTSGKFSWSIQTALQPSALAATPRAELCSWNAACTSRGSTTSPFGAANRVDISVGDAGGFNVVLACELPTAGTCTANGSQVRLYGGKATLQDTSTPKVQASAGTLVDDAALTSTETLALSATDLGSGLYRVRVFVDGDEVAAQRLDDHGGKCRDVNTANDDAYEFAHRQPCPASATAQLTFDTTGWPQSGDVQVLLEDAGRNSVTLAG